MLQVTKIETKEKLLKMYFIDFGLHRFLGTIINTLEI